MSKSKVYQLNALDSKVIFPHIDAVNEEIKNLTEDLDIDESLTITIVCEEISDKKLSKMPEFDGY